MPSQDKNLHILAEFVAVFIIAPITIYIATQQTNNFNKYFLLIVAILTLIVDGYLLFNYKKWNSED